MDDKELIAFLRRKLRQQDDAINAYLDALDRTGQQRQAAWDIFKAEGHYLGDLPYSLRRFLDVYGDTMQPRSRATEVLQEALTATFREAVLIDSEMTDEQRAYWLSKGQVA